MLSFIIRRLLIIIPMALLVVTLTWGLIRLAPGNFYSSEKKLPPAIEENIKKKYGLDKPWYEQYGIMMLNIVKLDFGESLKYQGQSVNEIIKRHFPYSATIGLLAYVLALFLGLTAGIIAALRQNSAFDYGSMSAAMLGLSVPNFVLGPILVLVFSLWFFWFPPARWGGIMSLVLPVVTLAMIYAAYIARLTRAGMLEVMRSDYIRTARAKGLPEWKVLLKHGLRGGIVPVVSFTGPALASLLAGTVVVEKVFAIPGLGNIFIQANLNRDEPLVLGIVAFLSILIMVFNLIVDVSYGFLETRGLGMNKDMTTVLTHSKVAFQPHRRKFTVNDFHKMMDVGILSEDGATEIIKGELVERMPIGSRHAGIVAKLSKLFEKRVGDESIIWSRNPIHLDDYNEPLPDVALLKLREDFYIGNNPQPKDVFLLAEVSDSTVRYDREEKTLLYAQAEILELWLINLRREIIEIYTQPDKGNYRNIQIYQHGEFVRSTILPNLQITVDEILGEQELENETEN